MQWERANFDPPPITRNRLSDFDDTRTLELSPEDHPPRKISFRSDDVGSLCEYPVSRCMVLYGCRMERADHYIFALWFLLSSFFFLFSSPNLSRRRLDVCHTSTHGVALVRI